MPAITVTDLTVLPTVNQPSPTARKRPVVSLTEAPSGYEGEGFPVKRAFAGIDLAHLDPFIMMDEMGEVDYAPGEPKGTPWHPHRGFETVTYIMDGSFIHQDSHGGGGSITNGDIQWMTAGSGLLHIETPPEELVMSGGLFHGLQLWVNLPRAQKLVTPRYQDLRANASALFSSADGASMVRLIAGDLGGHRGPGSTYSPMVMAHATIAPGATLELPWRTDFNSLVYVMSGVGTVGPDGTAIRAGQSAVLDRGDALRVAATDRPDTKGQRGMEVILLGGKPIREPVAWAGPFVMNTKAEVMQAFEDYQRGAFGRELPHLGASQLAG